MTTASIQYLTIPSGPNRHHHFFVPVPTAIRPTLTLTGSGDLNPGSPGVDFIGVSSGMTVQLYKFVFWSWEHEISTLLDPPLPTVPAGSSLTATAWYRPWPGGGGGGGGEVGIETWQFSKAIGGFTTVVPIASVSPGGLWGADPTDAMVVTNNSACDITAKNPIGSEDFDRWIAAPLDTSPAQETTSLTLHGTQGEDAVAVAFYGPRTIYLPPLKKLLYEVLFGLGKGPRIDPHVDPVPPDVLRIRELIGGLIGNPAASLASGAGAVKDDLSNVLERAAGAATHELQSWVGEVRSKLARLGEAERTLLNHLKGRGGE